MIQADRQVRSLKLVGTRTTSWDQARYAVEEGIRTASFPGLPPNAMVLVKFLDLGKIRLRAPVFELSQRIDDLVRALASDAVCVDTVVAEHASVVWFSDELTAYRALLRSLCEGKLGCAWYWQSLLPGCSLVLGPDLFSTLLARASRGPAQGLGIARLIESCIAPQRCDPLLSLITEPLVRRLLPVQGIDDTEAVPCSTTALDGRSTLGRIRGRISGRIHEHTHRFPLPDLGREWCYAIAQAVNHWGAADLRTRWFAYQGLLCDRSLYATPRQIWQQLEPGDLLRWSGSAGFYLPGKTQPQFHPGASLPANKQLANSVASVTAQLITADPLAASEGAGFLTPEPVESPQNPAATGQVSKHAGPALMISVLQRLGLDKLLDTHPAWSTLDFPGKLMRALATRFAVADTDPCWCVLGAFDPKVTEDLPVTHRPNFVCPLSSALQSHYLGSTRFAKVALNDLPLSELIVFFQLLCARFLWRHCRMSSRNLVLRPGTVYLTDTHWDVVFKLEHTDLRLRRLAIDSDPGWVPWLGRVVQFHFVQAEY